MDIESITKSTHCVSSSRQKVFEAIGVGMEIGEGLDFDGDKEEQLLSGIQNLNWSLKAILKS